MKATMQSTDLIVDIPCVGHVGITEARVWEGVTESGVRFTAYIPLVMVLRTDDHHQFEEELIEHKKPDGWTQLAVDMRMVV